MTQHPRPEQNSSTTDDARILVMAGSSRIGSLNGALARTITDCLVANGESVALVDLADYAMPLYHGDDEVANGVPAPAWELARLVAAAEVLVVVSPEYNGAFSPLLKNTIDWTTRAQRGVLAHLHVLLAAASPGARGGVGGLALLRHWMENMGLDVAEHMLSVGNADLDADGRLTGADAAGLDEFLDQVANALTT